MIGKQVTSLSSDDEAAVIYTACENQALAIRDQAVAFVQTHGDWEDIGPARLLVAKRDLLIVTYRTPFQKHMGMSDEARYWRAMRGLPGHLPYCIEVWSGFKVLNIEWDSDGRISLLTFIRGNWEQMLR